MVHTSCNAYEILDHKEIEFGCCWHWHEQGIQATGSPVPPGGLQSVPRPDEICAVSPLGSESTPASPPSWVWPENPQSKVPRHLNWIFQQNMKALIVCTEDRYTLNSELKARRPQTTHPSTPLFFFHLLSTNGVDRQHLQTPPSFLSEVHVQFDSRWHVNTWEGKQNHFCCGSHLSGCHQDYHDDNQTTNSLPCTAYFCIFVYLM